MLVSLRFAEFGDAAIAILTFAEFGDAAIAILASLLPHEWLAIAIMGEFLKTFKHAYTILFINAIKNYKALVRRFSDRDPHSSQLNTEYSSEPAPSFSACLQYFSKYPSQLTQDWRSRSCERIHLPLRSPIKNCF